MFFRRATAPKTGFAEYLTRARQAGFTVDAISAGKAKLSRGGIAAELEDVPGQHPKFSVRAGVVVGTEIATLVDGGFQKFLETPSGLRKPALASDLKAIHEFEEDLREAVGIDSLYNQSLGTVSNQYIYDRVEERDQDKPKAPWKIRL